jgi:hypothetical protein
MKKIPVLCFFVLASATTLLSCRHNNHDIDISVSESDDTYSMKADFSTGRTREVDEFMDERIGRRSNMSFVNSRIDGELALDDHTRFYIQKYPGHLEIRLNKDSNSEDSYHAIKTMCTGIKKLLAK